MTRRRARGGIDFGDLASVRPLSTQFGFDRGLPIDRYYIERFLERFSADVAGSLLEVGDDGYSRRFGGSRVTQQDVLHVHPGNLQATIVRRSAEPGLLPDNSFDCMIITQTLQLIFDFRAAITGLHEALKPGGESVAHGSLHQPAGCRRSGIDLVLDVPPPAVDDADSSARSSAVRPSTVMLRDVFAATAFCKAWRPRRWIAPSCSRDGFRPIRS